jgi:ABC-type Fe3+ transport system permease subunit
MAAHHAPAGPRRRPARGELLVSYVILICVAWILVVTVCVVASTFFYFLYGFDLSNDGQSPPKQTQLFVMTMTMNGAVALAATAAAVAYTVTTRRSLGLWVPAVVAESFTVFWAIAFI